MTELLKRGASVNQRGHGGTSCLFMAASGNLQELMDQFIEAQGEVCFENLHSAKLE